MYKIIVLICLSLALNAQSLILNEGQIKAHTEVFGDNEIDPISKEIQSRLSIEDTMESIRGVIAIESLSLKSQKNDRDEHMYELLHAKAHPIVSFRIDEVSKVEEKYQIKGHLTLNGISKEVTSLATISDDTKNIVLNGAFDITLTQFNMEPPTMFFLTVRDQIDITYNLSYAKETK